MIITKKIFIDDTAWYTIIDDNSPNHSNTIEQFHFSLNDGTKLFTSNIAVGNAISRIKERLDIELSLRFNQIVEEAHLGNHIRILWIGRRTQKEAVRLMRKHPQIALPLYDFAHSVLMQKRRINTIMSERSEFKKFGYSVLPEIPGK